jgi:hypothetical protein
LKIAPTNANYTASFYFTLGGSWNPGANNSSAQPNALNYLSVVPEATVGHPSYAYRQYAGNRVILLGSNSVTQSNPSRVQRWAHLQGTFDYPGDTDVLIANLWKSNGGSKTDSTVAGCVAPGCIRVSLPHLSFHKNSPFGE